MATLEKVRICMDQLCRQQPLFQQLLGAVGIGKRFFRAGEPAGSILIRCILHSAAEIGSGMMSRSHEGTAAARIIEQIDRGAVFMAHASGPFVIFAQHFRTSAFKRQEQPAPVGPRLGWRRKGFAVGRPGKDCILKQRSRQFMGQAVAVRFNHSMSTPYTSPNSSPNHGVCNHFSDANQAYMEKNRLVCGTGISLEPPGVCPCG